MTKVDRMRVETSVRNLDALLGGGLPRGSATVLAGPPGAGKTILTQQICFHDATPDRPVLFFSTLSEPTAKTLRYLKPFAFFRPDKLADESVRFVDLGALLRTRGLEETTKLIMDRVREAKPGLVVIDSFKAFDDLARSPEELRKFGYELAVHLMAWEATTFLLGEYGPDEIETNPLFSIVDGLIVLGQRRESGEQQRFLQVVKMRGADHDRDVHPFQITADGVEIFAPRLTIPREDRGPGAERCRTGVSTLDGLLGDGIPRGSSLLVAGVAGTGKTALLLEFVYRGAQAGEKGIVFSFEETEERLLASARGLGWDLDREIDRGLVEIVFIPQPEIAVEKHLVMMQDRVARMGARRVAIDSVSVFLHKVTDPQIAREKTFQLASIVQNSQAVGFFATDIPYGSGQISRFGVEETVVDGILLLTSTQEGLERQRYLEIYKLRNTAHLKGRHDMTIGPGGMTIYPRYDAGAEFAPPPPLAPDRRLSLGVPGLDELCGGGVLERSVTLVSGSTGVGKSVLALQFLAEGTRCGDPGLYVSLEESPAQLQRTAEALGLPLGPPGEESLHEFLFLSRGRVRASQLLALLTERIRARGARRVVLDGVDHLLPDESTRADQRELLFALAARSRVLGATTVLTVESGSLYATGTVTDRGFSPIADNVLLLRYRRAGGIDQPTLAVLKTRGSPHDRGTFEVSIGAGGLRIGSRVGGAAGPEATGERGG